MSGAPWFVFITMSEAHTFTAVTYEQEFASPCWNVGSERISCSWPTHMTLYPRGRSTWERGKVRERVYVLTGSMKGRGRISESRPPPFPILWPINTYILPNFLPPHPDFPRAYEITWVGHEPDILPDPTFHNKETLTPAHKWQPWKCASDIALNINQVAPLITTQELINNMKTAYPHFWFFETWP